MEKKELQQKARKSQQVAMLGAAKENSGKAKMITAPKQNDILMFFFLFLIFFKSLNLPRLIWGETAH